MKPIFVIEHLDPKVWPWCLLEYKHISKIVGRKNLWFTNIKRDAGKLKQLGKVFSKKASQLKLSKVCILDSSGRKTLQPSDVNKFDYFVFGGILGDWPEVNKSLAIIRAMPKAVVGNLGKKQMSTDTAVLVTKKILDGIPMNKIPFKDGIEITISKNESIELPYRYVTRKAKPVLPSGLVKMLKEQKEF